jgi:hypothetical protein
LYDTAQKPEDQRHCSADRCCDHDVDRRLTLTAVPLEAFECFVARICQDLNTLVEHFVDRNSLYHHRRFLLLIVCC